MCRWKTKRAASLSSLSSNNSMEKNVIRWTLGLLALGVCVAITWYFGGGNHPPEESPISPPVELLRTDLELREDQRLYAHGEQQPFKGLLVESFSEGVRKMEIEIHDGKAHGHSRGWFENGQMEVDETFVEGVSNGGRTRWYANGKKRSQAEIVEGVLQGTYQEWHENGTKAAEMIMKDGVTDGPARAWYPSGFLKSRFKYDAGKITKRESWPESAKTVEAIAPGP